MFVSLALGLYSETIKNHLEKENKLNCKDKIAMYSIGIANCVSDEELSPEHILPYAWDKKAHATVAKNVKEATIRTGAIKE